MSELIQRLQAWYLARCDGEWEHRYGIDIGTLDNPGFCLRVDLMGTPLEPRPFSPVNVERSEQDWYHCWVEDQQFHGAGGARNLEDLLRTFLEWAEQTPSQT